LRSKLEAHLNGHPEAFVTVLTTNIDRSSPEFRANDAHHRSLAAKLWETVAAAAQGGSASARDRHVGRGKLLPTACMTGKRQVRV
jgi:hypothetical protein